MIFGNYQWGLKTNGDLTTFNKLQLLSQFISTRVLASINKKTIRFSLETSDYNLPDSKIVSQAMEYVKDTHEPLICNHCIRTYIFGSSFGNNTGLKYDKEVLALSSLFHDVALTESGKKTPNPCRCFAIRGAATAATILKSWNYDDARVQKIQDAISLHLNIKVPISLPEAFLLQKGAATDVIGANFGRYSTDQINIITRLYPRYDFKIGWVSIMERESKNYPETRVGFLFKNKFPQMITNSKFKE
jgi:hypothetical protein